MQPIKIILADADPTTRRLAQSSLERCGHEVYTVRYGADVLGLLDRFDGASLLITDILLPGCDGYRVANIAKLRWRNLPVLYTTDDPARALPLLSNSHGSILLKPYPVRELVDTVRRLLPMQSPQELLWPMANCQPPFVENVTVSRELVAA